MKTITKEFNCTLAYDLARLGDPESILFFDIETTGLSAKRDMVYLIGSVYLRDGVWYRKQWFADTVEAEAELLIHFFLFSSRFSLLIHFNGSAFDLPFLKERADLCHTPGFGRIPESLDLYRELRPLKKLLGLSNCRQKTLEAFLGTEREDPYDGGQLIRFYWQYLRTGESALYDALLLHNAEDIEGLPSLLSLLSCRDFFRGEFFPESEGLLDSGELLVTCVNPSCTLPLPCSFPVENGRISCRENTLTLRLPTVRGTLKYFFERYTDYYYLPQEDQAIHKSVAVFVDPLHRKKATAKTCYQKHEGVFFSIPKKFPADAPLFYAEYKKNPPYMEYKEGLFLEPAFLRKFLLATLPK